MTSLTFLPSQEGFLGLEPADAVAPENAQAVIVPFGLEASVSYGGGTASGPHAILQASHQVELFDEEFWREPFRDYGVATVAPFPLVENQAGALAQLEGVIEPIVADGRFPLVLGGEHSLTPAAIRPFTRRYPDLALLHLDAHADLRESYEGNRYSHASALRRCLDNEDIRLVSFGIRNISAEEVPFLENNRDRIEIFWAKDKKDWRAEEIAAALKGRPTYLTIDMDGFDSSVMPATGTPEPGGVFWDETLAIIRAVAKTTTIVGADITELAPRLELASCDFLAAKLAYKILSYALVNKD